MREGQTETAVLQATKQATTNLGTIITAKCTGVSDTVKKQHIMESLLHPETKCNYRWPPKDLSVVR